MSVLVLGFIVAVALRLATGSATVATVTAAGIVAPLASSLSPTHAALLALAIGAGPCSCPTSMTLDSGWSRNCSVLPLGRRSKPGP